jgi:chemotaxis family two-component system response regulator Rcp1
MTANLQPTARIFLAEDNPADVYLIERALREHGVAFELEVAENGKQALSFLRRGDRFLQENGPALILLDLNLPMHDGPEILQCIRQTHVLASVPVVVLTSSDSPKDQIKAMGSGANRYIRKPSNLDEFMAIGAALKDLLAHGPEPTVPG